MTRRTLILFVSLSMVATMGPLLIIRLTSGIWVDAEVVQVMMLGSLVVANFFYLFYRLYKISQDAAVIFVGIIAVAMPLAQFVYRRLFNASDPRAEWLHLLAVLLVTTGVVLWVGRRRGVG